MAFTYFFRDLQTLELIVEHLLPTISGRSSVKIWDAGCASGQEPYTLAILLAENMGKYAFKNVKIIATDIDISDQFKEIIESGVYPYNQLQRIPENLFKKYFEKTEKKDFFQVQYELRNRVHFKRENLLSMEPADTGFSLVICKNVLLHQKPDERRDIVKMFHNALLPGGLLAMEHTQKLPEGTENIFEQVVSNAQLYRKK